MADELQTAIALLKSGKKVEAGPIFSNIVQKDPNDEQAWFGLSLCVVPNEQKKYCLNQVLRINPQNQHVKKILSELEFKPVFEMPVEQPVRKENITLPPVGGFQKENLTTIEQAGTSRVASEISHSGLNITASITLGLLGLIQIMLPLFVFMLAPTAGGGDFVCIGIFNLVLGVAFLISVNTVWKYTKRAPREMIALAIFGGLVGIGVILNGATGLLGLCTLPFYFLPAILVHLEKAKYVY